MAMQPLFVVIARRFAAIRNCTTSGNDEWAQRHAQHIHDAVREHMPSGSGFDNGTEFDVDASTPDRLVFTTSFHHHGEHGYCGWTDHTISVRPSLAFGFVLHIGGKDRNHFKDYAHDVIRDALLTPVEE